LQEFPERVLVTIRGDCFAAQVKRKGYAPERSSDCGLFALTDKTSGRGLLRVAAYVPDEVHSELAGSSGSDDLTIMLSTIRRAFDTGELSFAAPELDRRKYTDIVARSPRSLKITDDHTADNRVRDFIRHKAYWQGYRLSADPGRYWLDFAEPIDLDYLGVGLDAIKRNLWFFGQKGLLEMPPAFGTVARPTVTLVESYVQDRRGSDGSERVFPPGTPYDSHMEIRGIFRSARDSLLILDNYADTSLLDMVRSVAPTVSVQLLTHSYRPDFLPAAKRFIAQFPQRVEIRKHSGQVHDRFVVVDNTEFYSLGPSIKDVGGKLGTLHKLQNAVEISRLRELLTDCWGSARPIQEA